MRALGLTLLVCVLAMGGGCETPDITEAELLGGVEVPASTLELGRKVYQRYCQSCHGQRGDGRGPSSVGQWPPPRDFRTTKFKFAGIEDRGLPDDAELARIIGGGLAGTYMRDWDLSERQMHAVIQYIKTFSPPGKGFRSESLRAKKPELPANPYHSAEAQAAAIDKGRELYHVMFQCSSCHPAYVGRRELLAWEAEPRGENPFEPVPKWSANYRTVLLPPDFLRHPMRAVRAQRQGDGRLSHEVEDLVRTIAFGLQGPMPGYGHLGADNIWAVAYYVKSLADLRDSPEGEELRMSLREQR